MKEKSKRAKPQRPELFGFSKRLQAVINSLGVEQQSLAKASGKNNSTITEYLKAKSQPSQDVVASWIKSFDVNANWLLTGEGPMFRKGDEALAKTEEESSRVRELERKIIALQQELLESKNKIIALYERQAGGQDVFSTGAGNAPTIATVARSTEQRSKE